MSTGEVIAVDVGGTHTDAALLSATGRLYTAKVRSTPADPAIAFLAAIDRLLTESGTAPQRIAAVVHGTTVATNAVIEGSFARVGLLVTAGFEDILEIGTQQRVDLYDPWRAAPAPLVPRSRVIGVRERRGADGEIVLALVEDDVRAAARTLRGLVDAVAVSYLFSFVDAEHEQRTAGILAQELPGVPISLSSEVAPELREYPRTTTTALNAALLPGVGGYLARLSGALRARGIIGAFQLMSSGGGVIPVELAERTPVSLLVSGPAGGAMAAAALGAQVGEREVVMLDVGGTSADVAVITEGVPQHRYRGEVSGMPVAVPQIDVLPIGAGGGSLASVDDFGSLRVGPESAGADPGPAAYGRGERATTTDAHLVLGALDATGLLGGTLSLDPDRARAAIARSVAEPLAMSVERAAGSIVRIADARMADALRAVTIARGIDVRGFALMAFGGAGPLHACAIAEELEIARVIVPRYPGLTSALGLLLSDGRIDVARTLVRAVTELDVTELGAVVAAMSAQALSGLAPQDAEAAALFVDADLRYAGQAYELTIPVAPAERIGECDAEILCSRFHARHQSAYGHAWPDLAVELVTLRLRAVVPRIAGDWAGGDIATQAGVGSDRAGADRAGRPLRWRVVPREGTVAGLSGPAIITQPDTTTVLAPGWRVARVHGVAMVLEREGA